MKSRELSLKVLDLFTVTDDEDQQIENLEKLGDLIDQLIKEIPEIKMDQLKPINNVIVFENDEQRHLTDLGIDVTKTIIDYDTKHNCCTVNFYQRRVDCPIQRVSFSLTFNLEEDYINFVHDYTELSGEEKTLGFQGICTPLGLKMCVYLKSLFKFFK